MYTRGGALSKWQYTRVQRDLGRRPFLSANDINKKGYTSSKYM